MEKKSAGIMCDVCKERSVESNVVVMITTGLVASKQPWWPELRYLRNQERRG